MQYLARMVLSRIAKIRCGSIGVGIYKCLSCRIGQERHYICQYQINRFHHRKGTKNTYTVVMLLTLAYLPPAPLEKVVEPALRLDAVLLCCESLPLFTVDVSPDEDTVLIRVSDVPDVLTRLLTVVCESRDEARLLLCLLCVGCAGCVAGWLCLVLEAAGFVAG